MEERNLKFLNQTPLIFGFDFFDCVWATFISLFLFIITGSHILGLVAGFAIVISKSLYRKLYPKNSLYFLFHKKEGVRVLFLLNEKEQR